MVDEYAKFALLELNTIFPLIVEPWIKMEKELIKSINISSFLDGCDDDLDDSESDDYIHDKLVHNLQKEIHKYYLKLKSQIISYSWEDIGVVQKAVITSILEKVEQLKGFIDDSPVINKYIAEPKEFINLITDNEYTDLFKVFIDKVKGLNLAAGKTYTLLETEKYNISALYISHLPKVLEGGNILMINKSTRQFDFIHEYSFYVIDDYSRNMFTLGITYFKVENYLKYKFNEYNTEISLCKYESPTDILGYTTLIKLEDSNYIIYIGIPYNLYPRIKDKFYLIEEQ